MGEVIRRNNWERSGEIQWRTEYLGHRTMTGSEGTHVTCNMLQNLGIMRQEADSPQTRMKVGVSLVKCLDARWKKQETAALVNS